ncbi:MAG: sugar phosphate isomerase/epimerase [Defluviitaleaceae bacterium]|nr:sugar phosphate isomerase/epimerase [Defluviitaleaceae bacterium]
MGRFVLSGFADEITVDLSEQINAFKRLGISFMELRFINGKNIMEYPLEDIKSFRRTLDAGKIGVSAIGSPIGKAQITDDFGEYFKKFTHVCDVAELMGTKNIRIFSFYFPEGADPKDYRAEVIRRLGAFVEEAERRGLVLLHENEAAIYGETADGCRDLFDAIPSENFMAVFDPANFVFAGEEVFPRAYGILKDRIKYVHIKDAAVNGEKKEITPAGEGDGRLPELLKKLGEDGYEGFLSIEPHLHSIYNQMDIFAAYRKAKENGDPTDSFVSDGFAQFKRARDALAGIIGE